jgi:spore coat polysaccharide biosynthesis protein SpsF
MNGAQTLVILQARTGSTRLPGKVLTDVEGTSILERCIRRLQSAQVGPVVVATTALPADDAVATLAGALGARVVRGSVDDVLARFVLAVSAWPGRYVIRATADNPLVDPQAARRVLEHLRRGADYVVEKGLPVGAAVEGMTIAALCEAGRAATDCYDREHVTPWIRRATHRLVVAEPGAPKALARWDLRFTVDTLGDLQYVRAVVADAGAGALLPIAAYIAAADRLAAAHPGGTREAL